MAKERKWGLKDSSHYILNIGVWKPKIIPKDWRVAFIVPIHKKGGKIDYSFSRKKGRNAKVEDDRILTTKLIEKKFHSCG